MSLNTLEVQIKREAMLREARKYRLARIAQQKPSRPSQWLRLTLTALMLRPS